MSRIDSDNVNLGNSFVLKIEKDPQSVSSKIQHALEENNIKALSIIETAKQEAINIVNEAKTQAQQEALALSEEIKQAAQKEGYDAGFLAGKEEGLSNIKGEFNNKIEIFNSFVENSFDIKKRIIKSMHLDMINLIVLITDKICHKKLDLDKNILLNLTESAINELKEKEDITIIVNPQIRNEIMAVLDLIKNQNSLISNIKITEDSSISPDGSIVESIDSRVDSRISSQIDELTEKLLSEIKTQSEELLVKEADDFLTNNTIDTELTDSNNDNF
ncbi:MAG: FliH/SctL family protein [Candidatus Gastranaerophilales bacterium]|nr:FliH/SctL family protein [Candidatus Gastranaerophilales bacterium]